jgi:hypothetical protein
MQLRQASASSSLALSERPAGVVVEALRRLALVVAPAAAFEHRVGGSITARVATDIVTALPISSVALRQSVVSGSGMGTLTADDLIVATTFAEAAVVPEPAMIGVVLVGLSFISRRRRS